MQKIILIFTALCLALPFSACARPDCNDGKRVRKDMDNCADARYHLEQCGMIRLDRDGDGVPCESICGKGKRKR
ncbi:excalibur calcium-binding domain-containing protein [Actinobacillus sp. GY-402]|nr:excalibur calcium-binding domain-containing protein [Actinobacillus sp. GY-402]